MIRGEFLNIFVYFHVKAMIFEISRSLNTILMKYLRTQEKLTLESVVQACSNLFVRLIPVSK